MIHIIDRLSYLLIFTAMVCLTTSGCATGLWKPVQPWPVLQDPYSNQTAVPLNGSPQPIGSGVQSTSHAENELVPNQTSPSGIQSQGIPLQDRGGKSVTSPESFYDSQSRMFRGQSPQDAVLIPAEVQGQGTVQHTAALQGNATGIGLPTNGTGGSNDVLPLVAPYPAVGNATFPQNYADLDIYLSETNTGRINIGGAYNSDSGLVGQFVIDERNFDITRFPRSFRDIIDGTAWRGGGQNFRMELVPGNDVQRYLVSFSEPFLFNTAISFSTSLYYYKRQFFDWDEERLGGRFALGYRLTPDISISTGLRMENVEISDLRVMTSPQLNAVEGDTDLYIGHVSLIRDTRDHPFLPTTGNYTGLTFSQGFGEFDYSRGDIDFRTYRLMYERPDGSGRHTLSYGTKLGFTGSQTPVFENYFAGGFSTMRGFDFRGASPIEGDVRVGGEFQWLNTVEYMFPITADDMIKGVLFTDFGTVEENITINSDNFRVAPGFGFRVHLPAAGIGAPLAFDFAFPVASAAGDDEEVFSFYIGAIR